MKEYIAGIGLIILLIALFTVVPWLIRRVFYAGEDAITNKINQKRNADNAGKQENLVDRYR